MTGSGTQFNMNVNEKTHLRSAFYHCVNADPTGKDFDFRKPVSRAMR
jgi:hypothetical protein